MTYKEYDEAADRENDATSRLIDSGPRVSGISRASKMAAGTAPNEEEIQGLLTSLARRRPATKPIAAKNCAHPSHARPASPASIATDL
jgi:hypothetical protein